MKLEINLATIAETAEQKLAENQAFSIFLHNQNANLVDTTMHQLNTEITPKIDCLACGNCCHNLRPIASKEAMEPFVTPENMEAYKYLKGFACKNLNGKACTIYTDRPQECRSFPYLDRGNVINRTHELLQNYEICPIVFNSFEALKTKLNWQENQ